MRVLVRLEVRERDRQVRVDGLAFLARERLREPLHEAPPETRVTDLVRPDAGEKRAQFAFGHLEPLGADERDGHGLAHAADADDVARERRARRGVAMTREVDLFEELARRLAAE